MDSILCYLALVFIVAVSGEAVYQESYNTDDDEYSLHQRITALENIIQKLYANKLKNEQSVDLLMQEIQEVKRYSERKMQKLEEELSATNEKLFKAMNIIDNMDQSGDNKEGSSELSSRKIDRRLLISETTDAPNTVNGIAFSTSLTNHQENLGIYQIIRFDKVITNSGSGYDPVTGVFKAPVSGNYFFTVVIMSHAAEDIETQIVKNGTPLVLTYSGDSTTWNQGSQSTVVHLNVGDDVFVRIHDNRSVNDGNIRVFGGDWSSFSGFLISSQKN